MRREERAFARRVFKDYGAAGNFEDWLADVLQINVELHAGGRATVTTPGSETVVELRWEGDEITSFRTIAPPGTPLGREEIALSKYACALGIARGLAGPRVILGSARVSASATVTSSGEGLAKPQPGKPPSQQFYAALLAERDQLINEGIRNPVQEMARRHGVQVGTLKSWLSRGARYVRRGTDG
jgi:hypothetical protein